MENLVLVDGHNLLFQMYYGMPNKITNSSGIDIRGVIGFVGAINKIIDALKPDYMLVVFDSESEPIRKSIDPNYKSNRPALAENNNPFVGYKYIQSCLKYIHIPFCEAKGYECDDLIAKYATEYTKINTYIVSSDKDYYCLVNSNTYVYTYRGKNSKLVDSEYIKQKYNIDSKNFCVYKCLVGDQSDNIKGVKGIGPVTASKLIDSYPSFDMLINSDLPIINDNKQLILHNKSLIDFDTSVTLPYKLEQLKVIYTPTKTTQILTECEVY